MLSSVTTTVATVATLAFAASLGALASAILILLLAAKHIASAASEGPLAFLNKVLNIGILPLLMSFAVIVYLKVLEVLA